MIKRATIRRCRKCGYEAVFMIDNPTQDRECRKCGGDLEKIAKEVSFKEYETQI